MARGTYVAPAPAVDLGLSPALRDQLGIFAKALAGDLVFVITPENPQLVARVTAWTQTFYVELQSAAAEVHTWFNKAIASGVAVADDSTAGTATIPSTTLTFVNGVATVVVSGDAASWLLADLVTLTVAQATILGYTVAQKIGYVHVVTQSLSPSKSPSVSPSLSPSVSPS